MVTEEKAEQAVAEVEVRDARRGKDSTGHHSVRMQGHQPAGKQTAWP